MYQFDTLKIGRPLILNKITFLTHGVVCSELSKLMDKLEKNPKITRKDQNTIKKIQEIRDTIQDSVLYAKLKKSIE